MKKTIISIEVGTKIGETEVLSINYDCDKPYMVLINGEKSNVSIEELRKTTSLSIEDYNIPSDFYCKYIGITRFNCNAKTISNKIKNFERDYEYGEAEERCISGIETPYIDIELGLFRDETLQESGPYYTICINCKDGLKEPSWDTFSSINEPVKIKELTNEFTSDEIVEEYYKILMKHAKNEGLFVTKYN
ncbi:hypothetical protein BFS06_13775 [Clostridium perfringens]|uniref:hypothetical protein n=1 Tax=Clostridium perfringens TaxID=1502 RepID=UPI00103BE1C0|nr:hypothetical protein [Clostridium perfringens]TBX14274.1 hypothetical protein BFS06_13775 [Clostridium perfringens]